MKTYFISDLHLSDKRPDLTELYLDFMQNQAPQAEVLYILGDFFNFWIGDDEVSNINTTVAKSIQELTKKGVPCYYIHGNRDFLLGEKYAKQCNMTILPEHYVFNLYGKPTMLCHGDTLCLDDVKYQKFRKIVHMPWLQKLFLILPIKLRINIGNYIRNKSSIDKRQKPVEIMDVSEKDSIDAFKKFKVTQIIHGHIHKQGVHYHHLGTQEVVRIVLGDWGKTASILEVTPDGFKFNLER